MLNTNKISNIVLRDKSVNYLNLQRFHKGMGNVVAIIPARGGSKRIFKKNLKFLAGKPLIAYTIRASLKSEFIDKTLVSTDDEEIALVARGLGAEVIKRPAELAKDDSSSEGTLIHAVQQLKKNGYKADYVVMLQPTSPLRGARIIDKAVKLAISSNADSVLSVCEIKHHYLSGKFDGEDYFLDYKKRPFSHSMPRKYRENGAIYITKADFLIQNKNRLGGKIMAVVMNEVESLDIDEISDFELVEKIIKGEYYEGD